ncbi:MAG TPA: (2Fe-2S) ferredoxin domain-containing protein [Ohtaekwangia sp.]|nr:(2Fe-2S) ferredoxin domain-containing protein [Ohtaekwangia sp.]
MKTFSRAPECVLYVCCGSKCKAKGGKHLFKQLKSEVKHQHLRKTIEVIKTGCTDRCKAGPVIAVMPMNEWHLQMDEQSAARVLDVAIEQVRGK